MNDNSDEIVEKIDAKMGKGWASRFANVLATDMALKADVVFTFEKFNADGDYKHTTKRELK